MVKPSSQSSGKLTNDSTEQRILDAADIVFIRRGSDGARMQEIAEEANVNKALLHYYFRTKERLSEAVFKRAASKLLPTVIGIMASDLELEEKIDGVVATYLDELSLRPYLPGYIISELTHHPDRVVSMFTTLAQGRIHRQVIRKLKQQIDDRLVKGTIAPITAEQFLVTVLSSCIFPFAMRPMLTALLDLGPKGFESFIARRRKELPEFLKRSLRP